MKLHRTHPKVFEAKNDLNKTTTLSAGYLHPRFDWQYNVWRRTLCWQVVRYVYATVAKTAAGEHVDDTTLSTNYFLLYSVKSFSEFRTT